MRCTNVLTACSMMPQEFCTHCVLEGRSLTSRFLVQLDPKEIAKARARAVKAEAKAAQVAKETRGMKKMSAFFTKPRPAAKAAA